MVSHLNKPVNQSSLAQEIEALLCGFWLSDLANVSSYLFNNVPDLNWVGFYLDDGEKLRLGPFMGKPACLEIPYNKGVCGVAFSQKKSLIVDDVDAFPGHIRCDSDTKSELVVPFYLNQKIVGVLDIDSAREARFTSTDQLLMEKIVKILSESIAKHFNGQNRLI